MSNSDPEDTENLKERISDLEQRVSELESGQGTSDTTKSEQIASERPRSVTDETEEDVESASETIKSTLEQNVAKIFVVLGGFLLVSATLFFIRIAISAGLIGPLGQLLLAILSGFGVAGLGRYTIQNRDLYPWDKVILGTGVLISYIGIYASYGASSYQEALGTPYYVPFILLLGLIGVVLYDSVSRFDYGLTTLYMILAWITGLLILSESVYILGGFVLFAVVLAVGISSWTGWASPIVSSVIPAYVYFAVPIRDALSVEPVTLAVMGVSIFVVLEGGSLVSRSKVLTRPASPIEWSEVSELLLFLNASSALLVLWRILEPLPTTQYYLGLASLCITVAIGISYWISSEHFSFDLHIAPFVFYLYLGLSLTFLADSFVRILVMSLVVLLGVYLSERSIMNNFGSASHIFAGLLFVDALRVAYISDTFSILSVQMESLEASVFVILAALYYISFVAVREGFVSSEVYDEDRSTKLTTFYSWGGIISIILICQIVFSGLLLSVSWSILGLALIAVGLYAEEIILRTQGIALLLFTTAKVVLVDTSQLETIPRVASFLVLGVILIFVSYWYLKQNEEGYLPEVLDMK